MEKMTWIAELMDRMSGPAKRISRELGNINIRTGQGRDALGRFTALQKPLQQQMFGSAGSAMSLSSALGSVATGVGVAMTAFGALAYKIGSSAFEMFAFKESALATGKALWGSAEAAQAMFDKAAKIAKLTPFNVGEVVGAFNKLGAAGLGAEEVPVVFQGLSDIASMSGKGADAIGSMTLAFSQIMGRGKLASQELNQITEAAGGAVSRLKLFGEIAKIMGVAQGSIESMMEKGLIPARVAIMGVMQVAKGLGGGIIGQNSIEQSKTLGGLWSNLQDSVTNLWLTMDLTNAPWFAAVKRFLGGLIDALDTGTASGKELQAVFDRLFGRAIKAFIGDGSQDMSQTIINLAHTFELLAEHGIAAFKGLWDGLKAGFGPLLGVSGQLTHNEDSLERTRLLFAGIGETVADLTVGVIALAAAMNTLVAPFRWLGSSGQGLWSSLTNLAEGLVTADSKQISLGWDQMLGRGPMAAVGKAAGDGLKEGFGGAIEAHSPSRAFERFGGNVVDGFNAGVASVPGMDSTLASDLLAGAASSPGRGTGAPVSVAVTVNANTGSLTEPDSIAQRIADVTASTLASMFERMALEGGAA